MRARNDRRLETVIESLARKVDRLQREVRDQHGRPAWAKPGTFHVKDEDDVVRKIIDMPGAWRGGRFVAE
jgi:hypothetical protein